MQSHEPAQPLTLYDRVSVIIYRAGIVVFSLLVLAGGIAMVLFLDKLTWKDITLRDRPTHIVYFLSLYIAIGVSVGTIHLYAKRFRKLIRFLYLTALAGGVVLFIISGGSPLSFVLRNPLGPILLLPLAGTAGFIAMKEAFCFRFVEGYLLAIILPTVLLIMMLRSFSPSLTGAMIVFTGFLLLYLSWHKLRMPIGYDIGDKSLYEK
ncbi:MAG: hypothetical protein D6778_11245 [Nitrospirae bacterium]|nr:MAG: hypothetical protein D6778_11245 [Nitrospirota bacterium]